MRRRRIVLAGLRRGLVEARARADAFAFGCIAGAYYYEAPLMQAMTAGILSGLGLWVSASILLFMLGEN